MSPLARESDEEKPAAEQGKPDAEKKPDDEGRRRQNPPDKPTAPTPEDKAPAKKDAPFRIDFDGLEYRILDLPIPPATCPTCRPARRGRSTT